MDSLPCQEPRNQVLSVLAALASFSVYNNFNNSSKNIKITTQNKLTTCSSFVLYLKVLLQQHQKLKASNATEETILND